MINLLLFIIIGIFIAGHDGRAHSGIPGQEDRRARDEAGHDRFVGSPDHDPGPIGLFAATNWGMKAESNPGPHGLSEIVYQFSSASANNGSAFDGLGVTYGFNNNPSPAPEALAWDIAAGLVIIFSRFLPIVAPIAMAAFWAQKE